jgi:hypothetical protein
MLVVAVDGKGQFAVELEQVEAYADRCGIRPPDTIKYRVRIEGAVSEEGFVIEIQDIPRYFKRLYEEQRKALHSCERVAIDACEFFRVRGYRAQRVRVEIEANTNAIGFASAEWLKEKEVSHASADGRRA